MELPFFQLVESPAESPVLAAGGPNGAAVGLLQSEGTGLAGSGSDGVYYRPFDAASDTFGVPVLVSDETARTTNGPTGLALARDASGGAYASWLDHRGYVLAYSADGGATWSTPAAVGLESTASDLTSRPPGRAARISPTAATRGRRRRNT